MTMTPFVFNRNCDAREQVLPYYPEYVAVRERLDAEGLYPYNGRFKGKIPSLAGSTDKNEDTAIYLLQVLHTRMLEHERESEFIASGGRPLEEFDFTSDAHLNKGRRGTLVQRGQYVGGTGYTVYEDTRVTVRHHRGSTVALIKKPRQREWRAILSGGRLLFREG